jgi:hypothetical protein
VHEIQMILGNVAALSEPATTLIVPKQRVGSGLRTMISDNPFTKHGELLPMLVEARQHGERRRDPVAGGRQYLWSSTQARCSIPFDHVAPGSHRRSDTGGLPFDILCGL